MIPTDSSQNGTTAVPVRLQDLQDAVAAGAISQAQAHTLWARFCATGSPSLPVQHGGALPRSGPGFGFVNVLYYFGGMVAIGAMTLFMTLGFQAMGAAGLLAIGLAYALACLKVADHFKAKGLTVPAGILATLAVCLVPLVVWCVQSLMGLWPSGGPGSYSAYHTHIN